MTKEEIKNYIETLALAFTIVDETMPATPRELRKDLVRFAEEVVKKLSLCGVIVPKGTLNCPECGRHTQIVNVAESKAKCFYCDIKWEI